MLLFSIGFITCLFVFSLGFNRYKRKIKEVGSRGGIIEIDKNVYRIDKVWTEE